MLTPEAGLSALRKEALSRPRAPCRLLSHSQNLQKWPSSQPPGRSLAHHHKSFPASGPSQERRPGSPRRLAALHTTAAPHAAADGRHAAALAAVLAGRSILPAPPTVAPARIAHP